jgi:hypothetical protein
MELTTLYVAVPLFGLAFVFNAICVVCDEYLVPGKLISTHVL